jgi:hypothetical protein
MKRVSCKKHGRIKFITNLVLISNVAGQGIL